MLRKNRNAILLIAIGLVAAASGFWGNVASNNIPEPWKPYLWISWPLFGLFTIAGVMLAIIQSKTAGESRPSFSPTQEQRNRQAMLNQVYNTWVEGMLHKSLYKEVVIALGLQTQPDAIDNPWETLVQWPHHEPEVLPPGKKILDVFDEADCALLILGEPGSGKTTTLLQLAEQAIQRARNNDEEPIPVVFNLSSWTPKQTLSEWLVSELKDKYYVAKKIGSQWVEQDRLMFLLDGLDEVRLEDREQCVVAINTFLEAHSISVPICVCCRKQEYDDLAQHQKLNRIRGAILIQPLSPQQIDRYLRKVGRGLTRVYQVLKKDGDLHNFFETPLALSILALAFQNPSEQDITLLSSAANQRKRLFELYMREMLSRKGQDKRYYADQTKHWLSYIAYQLKRSGQNLFCIESIGQNWIPSTGQTKQVEMLVSLLVLMVLGLFVGQNIGVLGALIYRQIYWQIWGRIYGLIIGLILGVYIELDISKPYSIKPTDKILWSWKASRPGLLLGLLGGLIGGLNIGWIGGLIVGLLSGLILMVIGGLLFGPLSGLEGSSIEKRAKPELGIQNSLRNAVFVWLIFGLFSGLIIGLLFGLIFGLLGLVSNWLLWGLMIGLYLAFSVGILIGLLNGGAFVISHYVFRIALYLTNFIPWDLVSFLDYTTDRILLRKVGGGYIFIHRMLMEHFAEMEFDQPGQK